MYIWTLSSLILLVVVGAIFSFRQGGAVDTAQDSQSKSHISSIASGHEMEEQMTLNDLPPPDDTYTPDQRRYS